MPQSDHWAVPFVVEAAIAVDPASVLDVGVGLGQFGLHLRQSLDVARGRLQKADWKLTLDGVELFDPYRNPLWDYCYDSVTIGDARTILPSLPKKYDLLLLCDVIEHFDKADGLALLAAARRAGGWVLVTTPAKDYPQGASHGNEAETHKSAWSPTDFPGAVTHEIRDTFLALVPGEGSTRTVLRPGDLPMLFENTAGSLARCTRHWFPQMLRARFGRQNG